MIALSVRRPVAVAMGCAAVGALGLAAFASIPVELLPDVRYPRLTIRAEWPGASPEMVEALVTTRLEGAARQVQGAREVRSLSSEGRAEVTVEFARNTRMEFAALELDERLASLYGALPPGAIPRVEPYVPKEFSAQDVPFMEFALYGAHTTDGLREIAEETLRPELLRVAGVTAVRIHGGEPREIRIELDPGRMEALGLGTRAVADAVTGLDVARPAGTLRQAGREYVGTVSSRVKSVADLSAVPLAPDRRGSGRGLRLGDVARVLDAGAEAHEHRRINGRPAVTVSLVRALGTNAVRVADRVRARVADLAGVLPGGLDLVLRRDESAEIRRHWADLRLRAGASVLVIFLVLLVFLGSVRSAGVVFATIAFSTLLAVNFLYVAGLSLNLLTLAGLAMGFGLVVDNAIVVLENVQRRWHGGEPAAVAAERGAREVALPVLASGLTTVIVFVPFLYLHGELRVYYLPFAYAVGWTLLASLGVAFTFVPALTARALRHDRRSVRPARRYAPLYPRLCRALVEAGLRYPWAAVAAALLALAGSYALFDRSVLRGPAWGPWLEETRIDVLIDLPRGSELERTDRLARHFEAKLATWPEVQEFVTTVRPASARIRVTFPDSLARTWMPVAIKEALVEYSRRFGGAEVRVYGFGPSFYGEEVSPPAYALKVLGYDYVGVREIAEDVGRQLARFARVTDVDTNASGDGLEREKATELVLTFDRERLAAYGSSVQELVTQVAAAVKGHVARNRVRLTGEEVDFTIKFAGYDQMDAQRLENLVVPLASGPLRLGEVTTLNERETLSRIARENQQYQRLVTYQFRGPAKLGDKLRNAVLANTALPPGYSIEKGRRSNWIGKRERRELYGVVVLALLLIYILTAALFESLAGPFVVLLTVPLALVGVFLIFFYTGATFTRSAHVGVIMTAGIAVNDAILWVHRVNCLRRVEKLSTREALVRGLLERARPILMTTATTVCGVLPLVLFGGSPDANVWNGLGYALIGGLAGSTAFVFTVGPALYLLLERRPGERPAA